MAIVQRRAAPSLLLISHRQPAAREAKNSDKPDAPCVYNPPRLDGLRGRGVVDTAADHTGESPGDLLVELLAATADGDRAAFARLYQESSGRLFAVALRILRRRDLAEDVLQDAYLTIWKKAGQYQAERGRPLAWMATIVRYRAIDRLRTGSRMPDAQPSAADIETFEAAGDCDGWQEPQAITIGIRRCLERLQPKQRDAILLAFYHGFTHEELAVRLDVPLGTVKSWVRRGLMQLKDCLDA